MPKKFNPQIADIARGHIGSFFKQRRHELNFTQSQLSKCAGIHRPHLVLFESGKQNLTINTLLALAGCLRLKIFFDESDPNTPAGFEQINEN